MILPSYFVFIYTSASSDMPCDGAICGVEDYEDKAAAHIQCSNMVASFAGKSFVSVAKDIKHGSDAFVSSLSGR
jgi:hypothetical protein